MSRLFLRVRAGASLQILRLKSCSRKESIRKTRDDESSAQNNFSLRMGLLVILLTAAVSHAQVPKPPWASGGTGTAKPAATDSSKTNGGGAGAAQNPGTTLKVDVKLVNVFVTVTDEHGAPVAGLKKEDFTLLEDGKPQTISVFDKESALPLSIVLDIDTSLSTRKDLPLELSSARRFAHAILRPVDALSLYSFSEIVSEVVPFTSDVKAIDRGVDRVRMGSATALYDALYLGAQALEPRKGRRVLVVITDGGDTVSRVDYKEAVRSAQEAEAIVYSIIVRSNRSQCGS